jgi:hypothetical protein
VLRTTLWLACSIDPSSEMESDVDHRPTGPNTGPVVGVP